MADFNIFTQKTKTILKRGLGEKVQKILDTLEGDITNVWPEGLELVLKNHFDVYLKNMELFHYLFCPILFFSLLETIYSSYLCNTTSSQPTEAATFRTD